MGFKDEYDFDLVVNDVKNVVVDEIERQLESVENRNACRCQDCILDITALALNHLKPNYRSSLSFKGVIYKQRLHTDSYHKAVEKVVRKAIEKISENPSHETS
jgi:competence protein ComFB